MYCFARMFPSPLQQLIAQFSALPGVGPKMAERLALHVFKQGDEYIDSFAAQIVGVKNVTTCSTCFNIAEGGQCAICADTHRNNQKLCIVEESLDIIPIERSRAFNGVYHVLGGTVKKNNDATLTIDALVERIAAGAITEVIIATNFTTEGDMTAMFLQRKLAQFPLIVSRLARGLATGSDIEYADDMTIRSSLNNREIIRAETENGAA